MLFFEVSQFYEFPELSEFKNKNKITFIVGGSGFIGREITLALLSSGAKVIVLDIKKTKNIKKKNYYLSYQSKLLMAGER